MTDDRSLERAARSWLEEGPTRAPDRAVSGALDRIQIVPQDRDLRIPGRLPRMNRMTRLAMMAAVAIFVVGAGALALRPASQIGTEPSPVPTGGPTGAPGNATILPTDIVLAPESPFAEPAGAPLPGDLVGRKYAENPAAPLDGRQLVLTLRAADDPHCEAMYEGRSTCFTVLWDPVKRNDPGARGSARLVDGNVVLEMRLVPFDTACVGMSATYAIEDAGQTLRGVNPPPCTFAGFREIGATACASVPTVFDTRMMAAKFALPMKLTVPTGWKALSTITGVLGVLNTGCPERADATWWGPELLLVDNARIHDPSDIVSSQPEIADPSHYLAWPSDVIAYLTALPGVTVVSGPEPISVGGVSGTQVVLMTPPMRPLVWMDGDHSPLGPGEPAVERRVIVIETGGHTLFLDFIEDPASFDARAAEFQPVIDSISFE
jgi:hypothetical protein